MMGHVVAVKVLHEAVDDLFRARKEAMILTELRCAFSPENM